MLAELPRMRQLVQDQPPPQRIAIQLMFALQRNDIRLNQIQRGVGQHVTRLGRPQR